MQNLLGKRSLIFRNTHHNTSAITSGGMVSYTATFSVGTWYTPCLFVTWEQPAQKQMHLLIKFISVP